MPTATALRQSLYEAHKLAPSAAADKQFIALTAESMRVSGGHSIRTEVQRLGFPDPGGIRPTDSDLLDAYRAHATQLSDSVTTTFNRMLENAVSRIPESATPEEAQSVVNTFLQAAHSYNQSTLIPNTAATARQTAISSFYGRNGLTEKVTWTWTRGSGSDEPDECQEAADASPAPYADLVAIAGDPPVHPNCECDLSADDIDPADLPSLDDLWTGD